MRRIASSAATLGFGLAVLFLLVGAARDRLGQLDSSFSGLRNQDRFEDVGPGAVSVDLMLEGVTGAGRVQVGENRPVAPFLVRAAGAALGQRMAAPFKRDAQVEERKRGLAFFQVFLVAVLGLLQAFVSELFVFGLAGFLAVHGSRYRMVEGVETLGFRLPLRPLGLLVFLGVLPAVLIPRLLSPQLLLPMAATLAMLTVLFAGRILLRQRLSEFYTTLVVLFLLGMLVMLMVFFRDQAASAMASIVVGGMSGMLLADAYTTSVETVDAEFRGTTAMVASTRRFKRSFRGFFRPGHVVFHLLPLLFVRHVPVLKSRLPWLLGAVTIAEATLLALVYADPRAPPYTPGSALFGTLKAAGGYVSLLLQDDYAGAAGQLELLYARALVFVPGILGALLIGMSLIQASSPRTGGAR